MDQGHKVQDILDATGRMTAHGHGLVIVDTCRLFREGLTNILHASCFNVVVAAANIQEALSTIAGDRDTTIDMLICSLDPQRGIEAQLLAIKAMRRRDPATKTVLLMPSCSPEDLVAAVLCGVDGVVLKDISGEKLIATLDVVMHGQHVLPLGVASQVFARLQLKSADEADARPEAPLPTAARPATMAPVMSSIRTPELVTPAAAAAFPSVFGAAEAASMRERTSPNQTRNLGLSERETQILQCLVEGCANKMIARRLDIAEATVKVHIKGLLRKINVNNRTQAAIWALNQSVSVSQARPPSTDLPPSSPTPSNAAPSSAEEPQLLDMIAVFPPTHSVLAARGSGLGSSGATTG